MRLSLRQNARFLRHAPVMQPWTPFGAHALSAVSVIAVSIGGAVLLLLLDLIAGAAGQGGRGAARPEWLRVADDVAVHLLVMWVSFLYLLVLFFPLFLLALRYGLGGALGGAAISCGIYGVWGLTLDDPAWPGMLLGLLYGGTYGLAFHPWAVWFRDRPPTRNG